MGFINWKREWFIRKVLRKLSRQRVSLILQPGNVWVIEKSVGEEEQVDEALRTCYLRGWVEPIEKAIPHGKLTSNGKLPEGYIFTESKPIYRLTEA